MNEMDPREIEIESLLRRSFDTQIPTLSTDFNVNLVQRIEQQSRPLNRNGRLILTVYGVLSVLVSLFVMRGLGLAWELVVPAILTPLLITGVVVLLQKSRQKLSLSSG